MNTARDGSVAIRIRTSSGRPFIVNSSRSETISSLKERITTKIGLYPHQQRLVYHGTVLVDELTVGFYGIARNQTLYLAPVKENRSIQQKPEEKLKKVIFLTQRLDSPTSSKFIETINELKELINDPLLKAFSRLDKRAADAITYAREVMETAERPQSRQTEQYLAKTTDYALSLVEAAPDGLRMLQSIIDDYSSDEETNFIHKPTKIDYKPHLMSKPLPPLKGCKNIFQSSAYRTLQTRKELARTPRDTGLFSLNDSADFDDLLEIPFGDEYDKALSQKFASQVEILKKMGFDDERNILEALGETNGNVQKAAKLLQNKFFYHV